MTVHKNPMVNYFKPYLFILYLVIIVAVIIAPWMMLDSQEMFNWVLLVLLLPMPIAIVYILLLENIGNVTEISDKIKIAEITAIVTIILISCATLYFVNDEQKQRREFKKYENYNYYNKLYLKWYSKLFEKVNVHKDYSELGIKEKAYIRAYFNLYAQEYFMREKGMIPEEMWLNVIHGETGNCHSGAMINLKEYPILIDGYKDWKAKGSFSFPSDFKPMLDKKLRECGLL